MIRPFPARAAVLLIGVVLVASACGATNPPPTAGPSSPTPSSTATPSPSVGPSASAVPSAPGASGDAVDAVFDAIEAQVVALRGLPPVDVARETIDKEALIELSTANFDQDNPADYVAANERLYKALGLMDEDASLKGLFLDLIGSQVAGFYRPDDNKLYVVSRTGTVNGADKITFAHEYVHALQDANFDIFKDPEALRDQTDQALARAAVYEGDATLLMTLWAFPNMTPAELQDAIAAGSDPESAAILAKTPAILREGLFFPYQTGVQFLQPIQTAGGWAAVDDLYGRLPVSTEQVMHAEKYQAAEKPVVVTLPTDLAATLGAGWSVAFQDTWGEFQTGVWLRESGVAAKEAKAAAAGWGGDRLAVLNGPDGAWAVAIQSTWDSDADATQFLDSAQIAVNGLGSPADVSAKGDRDVTILVASDDAVLLELDKIFGDTGA